MRREGDDGEDRRRQTRGRLDERKKNKQERRVNMFDGQRHTAGFGWWRMVDGVKPTVMMQSIKRKEKKTGTSTLFREVLLRDYKTSIFEQADKSGFYNGPLFPPPTPVIVPRILFALAHQARDITTKRHGPTIYIYTPHTQNGAWCRGGGTFDTCARFTTDCVLPTP